jgi:hypothetical protein
MDLFPAAINAAKPDALVGGGLSRRVWQSLVIMM